jgi:hypothetical protein
MLPRKRSRASCTSRPFVRAKASIERTFAVVMMTNPNHRRSTTSAQRSSPRAGRSIARIDP